MTLTQDEISALTSDIIAKFPEPQRAAATAVLIQYSPRIFEMAKEDILGYLMRLKAGDLDAAVELDNKLSDAEWLSRVKANSARWENVAQYNIVREQTKNEILLRTVPIVVGILATLVGL